MSEEQGRRGLLLVLMDVDPDHEAEFNEWYDKEHLAEKQGSPGFISARRFVAVDGSPKYLAIYDLESPDALQDPRYTSMPKTAWTNKMRPFFRNLQRGVYVETTPAEIEEGARTKAAARQTEAATA